MNHRGITARCASRLRCLLSSSRDVVIPPTPSTLVRRRVRRPRSVHRVRPPRRPARQPPEPRRCRPRSVAHRRPAAFTRGPADTSPVCRVARAPASILARRAPRWTRACTTPVNEPTSSAGGRPKAAASNGAGRVRRPRRACSIRRMGCIIIATRSREVAASATARCVHLEPVPLRNRRSRPAHSRPAADSRVRAPRASAAPRP